MAYRSPRCFSPSVGVKVLLIGIIVLLELLDLNQVLWLIHHASPESCV